MGGDLIIIVIIIITIHSRYMCMYVHKPCLCFDAKWTTPVEERVVWFCMHASQAGVPTDRFARVSFARVLCSSGNGQCTQAPDRSANKCTSGRDDTVNEWQVIIDLLPSSNAGSFNFQELIASNPALDKPRDLVAQG